jgi:hypothetical protein
MATKSTPNDILEYVAKYMEILGIDTPPEIKIANKLGSPWLGLCHWTASRPETSTITLQKRILAHPPTLERVMAHEMVHHWEFLNLTANQITLIRHGIKPTSHGPKFEEGAARVNSLLGPGFVTKQSDNSYELESNIKPFFLLITPLSSRSNRLGWAWCVRPSEQIRERITRKCSEDGSKLVITTDERWTCGEKIRRFGGMSVPPVGSDLESELQRLFASEYQEKGVSHAI